MLHKPRQELKGLHNYNSYTKTGDTGNGLHSNASYTKKRNIGLSQLCFIYKDKRQRAYTIITDIPREETRERAYTVMTHKQRQETKGLHSYASYTKTRDKGLTQL